MVGRCRDLLVLQPPKISLICKFCCLLNLPSANQSLPLSLISPYLPCPPQGIWIQITHGKPPKSLQTKNMDSDSLSMNFFIALLHYNFFSTLHIDGSLPMYNFIVPCIGHVEYVGYADLPNINTLQTPSISSVKS